MRSRLVKLVIIFLFTFMSSVSFAADTKSGLCDQSVSTGAIFYNFNRIIVLYNGPTPADEEMPGYPDPLKFDQLKQMLESSLKKTFGECLILADGKEKQISFIRLFGARSIEDIHDPDNLTVVFHLAYFKGVTVSPKGEEVGVASYFIYRPEVSWKDGRIPLSENSAVTILYPAEGDQKLRSSLVKFMGYIRPGKAIVAPRK
jgi:hypothetical protein